MAVHIRLQRKGTTHKPFYHVVVANSKSPRDGRFLEKVGYYDPGLNPSLIELKADRIQHWYERGAQLTESAGKLVKIRKIELKRTAPAA